MAATMTDYEYCVLTFPRQLTPAQTRRILTDHAEYGRWELARSRTYWGGTRRVWLRRAIIRVERGYLPTH